MKKIRWKDGETVREGVILGVIGKPKAAVLVIYCTDGLVREVAAKDIYPC